MLQLIAAAAFFLLIHLGVAGTRLRDALVARLGMKAWRALFSVASVAGIVWLVAAYARAPFELLWVAPDALRPVVVAVVLVAFLLMVPGLLTPNPTAANFESRLERADAASGIVRVTRHPFLWGTSLWAAAHLAMNGDAASLVLFGSLLLLCLAGTMSIDAKRRRAYGAQWERFAAATSNLPFGAIAAGRNRLVLAEIGWGRLALAVLSFAVVLYLHPRLFGGTPVH